jgi:hypothetical protein
MSAPATLTRAVQGSHVAGVHAIRMFRVNRSAQHSHVHCRVRGSGPGRDDPQGSHGSTPLPRCSLNRPLPVLQVAYQRRRASPANQGPLCSHGPEAHVFRGAMGSRAAPAETGLCIPKATSIHAGFVCTFLRLPGEMERSRHVEKDNLEEDPERDERVPEDGESLRERCAPRCRSESSS